MSNYLNRKSQPNQIKSNLKKTTSNWNFKSQRRKKNKKTIQARIRWWWWWQQASCWVLDRFHVEFSFESFANKTASISFYTYTVQGIHFHSHTILTKEMRQFSIFSLNFFFLFPLFFFVCISTSCTFKKK